MIWYALRVHPQREFTVERHLRDDGFTTFVPVKHSLVRPCRGMPAVLVAKARFNGYVFVGFDPGPIAWHRICGYWLITGVIGDHGEPLAFTETDMLAHVFPNHQRPIPYIGRKSKRKNFRTTGARIASGPYEGRTVRIVGLRGNEPEALFELFQAAERRKVA